MVEGKSMAEAKSNVAGMNDVFKTTQFLLENSQVRIIIHGSPRGLGSLKEIYPKRIHFAASLKKAVVCKNGTAREYIRAFRHKIHSFDPA